MCGAVAHVHPRKHHATSHGLATHTRPRLHTHLLLVCASIELGHYKYHPLMRSTPRLVHAPHSSLPMPLPQPPACELPPASITRDTSANSQHKRTRRECVCTLVAFEHTGAVLPITMPSSCSRWLLSLRPLAVHAASAHRLCALHTHVCHTPAVALRSSSVQPSPICHVRLCPTRCVYTLTSSPHRVTSMAPCRAGLLDTCADFLFKFLVIGNANTGKSCLLHQFIENKCE